MNCPHRPSITAEINTSSVPVQKNAHVTANAVRVWLIIVKLVTTTLFKRTRRIVIL